MNNFWTTVNHTASRRLKSKTFVVTNILIAVLIIGLLNINSILDNFSSDGETEAPSVAVIDDTIYDGMLGTMLESYEEGEYEYFHYTDGDVDHAIEEASNNEFAYVLHLSGSTADLEAEFYGEGSDYRVGVDVNQDVQRLKETFVTTELDLDEEQLAMIFNPVTFTELPLHENGDVQTEQSHMQAYWMVYGLVFAIYLIVIMLGTMIATEVATEKSSRVMELIVSSVNPVIQMVGKLTGIGIVGLVNIGIIVGAALIGSYVSGENYIDMIFTEVIDISLIVYALLLIVLGYLVYGGIAAMLGALVSRAEEVNQAIQPLIYIAMIALFISMYGLNVPDAPMIHVLSYVPFFTPQLLFLRIGMGTVPGWEVALIIGILIISAILINILAARIYKGGVLMYGKFSFKNGLKQAFLLSKKEN